MCVDHVGTLHDGIVLVFLVLRSPGLNVFKYHGDSKRQREKVLRKVVQRTGVLLTSYGLLINDCEKITKPEDRSFKWVSRIIVGNILVFHHEILFVESSFSGLYDS